MSLCEILGEHFGAIIKTYPMKKVWPSNNWKINYERASIRIVVDVDPEDPVIPPYYGPKRMCPSLSTNAYMPFRDLFASNFVLV